MAKQKGGFSAGVKQSASKKHNPFEIHINRQKHKVVGQKLKNEKGLPGVSRARALKKRKATLLQEYKYKNKANKFLDRRIGEKNSTMSNEDRVMARFAAEQAKGRRKAIFNLGDDEVLTHKGHTLNEIEKFDDPRSDDEDEDGGKLEASFVGDAHFGGGFLRKAEPDEDAFQSRQTLIQQLIIESKKRKAEKQRESEKAVAMTEKLDADWKELQSIVLQSKASMDKDEVADTRVKIDSYDKAVREMKFESRGKPSDRLKSEEELASAEKKKLEMLEMERVKRMHGNLEGITTKKHRSADDLDDSFAVEAVEDISDDDNTVADDAKNLVSDPDDKECDDTEDESENETDSDNSDGENDSGSESDLLELRYSSEGDENEEELETAVDDSNMQSKSEILQAQKIDFAALKEQMEKARQELPFTFDVPDTYENLQELLHGNSLIKQTIILERMLKCNHPSLKAGNRERLESLFAFLLQWLHDTVEEPKSNSSNHKQLLKQNSDLVRSLLPILFDLVQLSGSENAHRCVSTILLEKYEQWQQDKQKEFPAMDTLIFFQLIPYLFPTSDFRHPVVTPAVIMMANILEACLINTMDDLLKGLFICKLLLQYTEETNRFLPETLKFLQGFISIIIQKINEAAYEEFCIKIRTSKPFTASAKFVDVLDITDSNCLVAFDSALSLLEKQTTHLQHVIPSWPVFIAPILQMLNSAQTSLIVRFPSCIEERVRNLAFLEQPLKLEKLVMQKKKPRPLKMFEPAIEKITEGKRHLPMSEKKRESLKLKHKYKREMKGAVREIRRDRSFLAKYKLKEIMKSDAERKEKVKNLMSSLANQAGEVNKFDRGKKKRR